jgi:hypothetical protein
MLSNKFRKGLKTINNQKRTLNLFAKEVLDAV